MAGSSTGGGRTSASAPGSFEDGLTQLYTDTARLALAPDAGMHMQFIQVMQKGILAYRQQVQQQKAAAAAHTQSLVAGQATGAGGGPPPGGGMGSAPPGGDMGGGGMGPPPPPNQIAPGGGAGMSGYGGVVSPDDLQRVLSGAGGQ